MKGSQAVIDAMNLGLTIELTAINQYFITSKMCANWGLQKLAKHHYEESIEEMHHATWLIDHILFLDGVPEIARYETIRVGGDVKEQLEFALALELHAVETYNEGIRLALENHDSGSRQVMDKILQQTEESVDWLEAQLHLVEKIGIELYLQSQIGEGGED